MPRVDKTAAGEDVRVDTPEYGCFVIDETKPAAAPKTKPAAPAPDEEGAN